MIFFADDDLIYFTVKCIFTFKEIITRSCDDSVNLLGWVL
jgi:hypothetical protein